MNKRILVIDDSQPTLNSIKEALDYMGYEVKALLNPDEIFHHINDFKPDLILLDYFLDDINGGEICHQIKTCPATAHLPVIIVSGYTKVLLSLGTYGCDAVLPKPFGLTELLESVKSNISLKLEPENLYE